MKLDKQLAELQKNPSAIREMTPPIVNEKEVLMVVIMLSLYICNINVASYVCFIFLL